MRLTSSASRALPLNLFTMSLKEAGRKGEPAKGANRSELHVNVVVTL